MCVVMAHIWLSEVEKNRTHVVPIRERKKSNQHDLENFFYSSFGLQPTQLAAKMPYEDVLGITTSARCNINIWWVVSLMSKH